MQAPSKDVLFYSYTWESSADDPIETRKFFQELGVVSTYGKRRNWLAHLTLEPQVEFRLTTRLWRFTPMIGPGKLGKPVKVFTCETDGTRVIPNQPKADGPRPKKSRPSVGDIIEMHWGVQEPTGSKHDKLPPWMHVTRPFIEKVKVTMQFKDVDHARLYTYAPQTDSQHGSMSSSSSVSYSFSGGMFGKAGTGSGSVSLSYSHSNSMELKDYTIRSDSDEASTQHTIKMSMLDGGLQYTGWESAPTAPRLTERPTSDMPILCQGIWELPDIKDEVEFEIVVDVTIGVLVGSDTKMFGSVGVKNPKHQLLVVGNPGIVTWTDPHTGKKDYPINEENFHHTQKTFQWRRSVTVPLAAADKKVPEEGYEDGS